MPRRSRPTPTKADEEDGDPDPGSGPSPPDGTPPPEGPVEPNSPVPGESPPGSPANPIPPPKLSLEDVILQMDARQKAIEQSFAQQNTIVKDLYETLEVMVKERNAARQGQPVPPDQGPTVQVARSAPPTGDVKFEQAKSLMELAGRLLGPDTPPAGAALGGVDLRDRLANAAIDNLLAGANFSKALQDSLVRKLSNQVAAAADSLVAFD